MQKWFPAFRQFALTDFSKTVQRFPVTLALLVCLTALGVNRINGGSWLEDWFKDELLLMGFFTACVFATAITLICENIKLEHGLSQILAGLSALVVFSLCQVVSTSWIASYMLPALGIVLLSLSQATTRKPKDVMQNRYWWSNVQALTGFCFAILCGIILTCGFFMLQWSMDTLFGLRIDTVIENYSMPIIWLFAIPFYWLALIGRNLNHEEFDNFGNAFLYRAISFIGQYILVPFIIIYAVLLHVYAAQILFQLTWPKGTVGSLVSYYLVLGTVTSLVVYPRVSETSKLLSMFRKYWIALAIIPIVLLISALYIRISQYGLTPARFTLVLVAIWTASYALYSGIFRERVDIRFIPALALVLLLIATVGPFNVQNSATISQLSRLTSALDQSPVLNENTVWATEAESKTRTSISYLYNNRQTRPALLEVLKSRGVSIDDKSGIEDIYRAMNLSKSRNIPTESSNYISLEADFVDVNLDLTNTPHFIGRVSVSKNSPTIISSSLKIELMGSKIQFYQNDILLSSYDTTKDIEEYQETGNYPSIAEIQLNGRSAIILMESLYAFQEKSASANAQADLSSIKFLLFSAY